MKWIRSQAAHRHRLQPQSSLCGGENMLPVYSATFLPRLLSILFLPWFPSSPAIQRNYVCTDLPAVGLVNHAHPTSCQKTVRKEHGQAHPSVSPQNREVWQVRHGSWRPFTVKLSRGRPRGHGIDIPVGTHNSKLICVDMRLCVHRHS